MQCHLDLVVLCMWQLNLQTCYIYVRVLPLKKNPFCHLDLGSFNLSKNECIINGSLIIYVLFLKKYSNLNPNFCFVFLDPLASPQSIPNFQT